jgi:hypothetical protein
VCPMLPTCTSHSLVPSPIVLPANSLHSTIIHKRRLSLPASLLEPIPNLEYWHYADRPDIFARSVPFDPLVVVPVTEAHCDAVGYVRRYFARVVWETPRTSWRGCCPSCGIAFRTSSSLSGTRSGNLTIPPLVSTATRSDRVCSGLYLPRNMSFQFQISTLGEHFQCNWSLSPVTFDPKTKAPVINAYKFDPSTSGGERELVAMSAMSTPMVAAVETGDDV